MVRQIGRAVHNLASRLRFHEATCWRSSAWPGFPRRGWSRLRPAGAGKLHPLPRPASVSTATAFRPRSNGRCPSLGSGAGQAVPLTADTGSLLVLLGLEPRADRQGAGRPGGEPSLLDLLRRPLERRVHAQGHRSPDRASRRPTRIRGGASPAWRISMPSSRRLRPRRPAGRAVRPGGRPAGRRRSAARWAVSSQAAVSTVGDQRQPAVAVAPDGGFLRRLDEDVLDTPATVYGRLYDAAGQPPRRRAPPARDAPAAPARNPRVAVDPSGHFLAVWADAQGIAGRLFDADKPRRPAPRSCSRRRTFLGLAGRHRRSRGGGFLLLLGRDSGGPRLCDRHDPRAALRPPPDPRQPGR